MGKEVQSWSDRGMYLLDVVFSIDNAGREVERIRWQGTGEWGSRRIEWSPGPANYR